MRLKRLWWFVTTQKKMHGIIREQTLVYQGRRQQRWQSAMGAIVMADACSSAMEAIGATSPLSKQAVAAIVIAGACSQALAAICGLLPNQMLTLGLGVSGQNEAKGCTVGPALRK